MVELVPRFEWERLVRRAQIDPTAHHLALVLATYADADGTNIFPGNARLAAVSGRSESTVERALRRLREHGLVERVAHRRGQRRRDADEYRLTVPADFLERTDYDVLGADEYPSPVPCGQAPGSVDNPASRRVRANDYPAPTPGDYPSSQPDYPAPTPRLPSNGDGPPVHDQPTTNPSTRSVVVATSTTDTREGGVEPSGRDYLARADRIIADLRGATS